MEFKSRRSVFDDLYKYDILCNKDEHDFIEVTEWSNGEGCDITISDKKSISLTYGELDAINYLVNTLKYKEDDE